MRKHLLATAISSLCLCSQAAFAEAPAEIRVETDLPAQPAIHEVETDAVGSGIHSDSGEWLRSLPGVSGKRLGGHGIDPVVRGQGETRLNILLDGAYVHGGCPNRMDPPTSYAPLSSYDQATLYKGSQTVRYGGGGSGGTLILERTTPAFGAEESPRAEIEAGYASNGNRRELFGDIAMGNATGFVRLLAGYGKADNYEDGEGDEVRTAYQEKGANVILGLTPDRNTRIELSAEATRGEDMLFAGGMDSPMSDHDVLRLKASRNNMGGFINSAAGELYYSDVHHVMDNYSLRTLTAPMMMEVPSDSITRGGRITLDHVTDNGALLTFGVDLQRNNREAVRYAGPTLSMINSIMWPDVTIAQTGLFLETAMDLSDVRRLTAGIRYDHVSAEADRAAEMLMGMGLLSPNQLYSLYYGTTARDQSENNVGGFIKLEQDLDTTMPVTVFGNLSRSVRTADATERYMAANNPMLPMRWVGNPDINPEQHHQLEIGISATPASWNVTTTAYIDYVEDYILRDTARLQDGILVNNLSTIYRNVNAKLMGYEFQARQQLSQRWSSSFGVDYVRGINTTDSRDLAQIPALEFTASLAYQADSWDMGARLRGADRQTRVDGNISTGSGLDNGETAGYAVMDLYGSWQAADNIDLKWGIDNVFDRTYAEHLNRANDFDPVQVQINEPGRSIWLKANTAF